MLPFNLGVGGASGVDTGDIPASLRFRSGASPSISKTFSGSDNSKCTISLWVKRNRVDQTDQLFEADTSSRSYIAFENGSGAAGNALSVWVGGVVKLTTSALYRDVTNFLHICLGFDGSAAGGTLTLEVNGNVVGSATGVGATTKFCSAVAHLIGRNSAGSSADIYVSRVAVVSGQKLSASSFGYLNTEINEWVSKSQSAVKAVVDAGGTNSFMLDFDDATSLTTLGYDKSSKSNNWTPNNFSLTAGTSYDRMLDVPGNSFATLNPVDLSGAFTLSAGNLHSAMASAANGNTRLTLPCKSTTYVEYINNGTTASNTAFGIGIALTSLPIASCSGIGGQAGVYGFYASNVSWLANGAGSNIGSGGAVAAGTIMQIAYDPVAQKMWVGKNNVWYDSSFGTTGDPSTGANPTFSGLSGEFAIYLNNYTNNGDLMAGQAPLHTSATYDSAAGGYFRYAPPTGFKALCQRNMPDGESITTSGSFTGTLNADGPYIDIKGVPTAMTINGNAVTFGTHADKTSSGFKIRTASSSYNNTGSNTFSVTSTGAKRKYSLAQGNP